MAIKSEKNIRIKGGAATFLADTYYSENGQFLPLLIFAHGYKGYKDWGAWHLMAKKVANAGFFFVKFNFSHNGTTPDNPTEFADLEAFGQNNFTKEMLDYNAVTRHFLQHPKVDRDKLGIIGHSRGGGISIIKGYEDEAVRAVAVLAGVSHFGYRFPSGERLERWQEEGVMYSENARTKQQMPHYYQFYEDYKANEDRFNIQYAAQHLDKPLLIVQGTEDEAVKDKEAYLLHEWCKQSELEILDGTNHTFGAKEPWTSSEMPKNLEKASEFVIEFFKKNFNKD